MRILKSTLIVLLAGTATVLLAIAAKVGLEAVGIEIIGWRQTVVPALSGIVVIYLVRWRIRTNSPVTVGRVQGWAMATPMIVYMAVMLFLVPLLVTPQTNEWWWWLAMWSLFAAAIISSLLWEAHKAVRAAERAE